VAYPAVDETAARKERYAPCPKVLTPPSLVQPPRLMTSALQALVGPQAANLSASVVLKLKEEWSRE
jgi:hypothetical protein